MKFRTEFNFSPIPENSFPSVADDGLAEIPRNQLPLHVGGQGRGDYRPELKPRRAPDPSPELARRIFFWSIVAIVIGGAVCLLPLILRP